MRQTGSPRAGFQRCLPLYFDCPGISIVEQGSGDYFFKARRDYNLMRQHLSQKIYSIYDQYNSKPDNKVNIIKSGTWSNDHLQLSQPLFNKLLPSLSFRLSRLLLSLFKAYLLTTTCWLSLANQSIAISGKCERFADLSALENLLLLLGIFVGGVLQEFMMKKINGSLVIQVKWIYKRTQESFLRGLYFLEIRCARTQYQHS